MNSRRLSLGAIVALGLAAGSFAWLGSARQPDAVARAAEAAGGRVVREAGIVLVTDVDEELAELALAALRDADTVLDRWIGPLTRESTRIAIWSRSNPRATVAGCDHDFERLAHGGAQAFHSRSCGIVHVLVDPLEDRDVVRRVLMHEAVHQRLAVQGLEAGPDAERGAWFGEGLATLSEACDEDGRIRVRGVERIAVARALRDARLLAGAAAFCAMPNGELERMGEIEAYYSWRRIVYHRAVSAFHTQAYALAAFLHERLGARFSDFVRGAVEQGCGPRQLAAALGTTPDGLDASFNAWLDSLDLTSSVGFER